MAADVIVGYLHPQQVDGAFHDSLVTLLFGPDRDRVAGVCSIESGPIIEKGRNQLAWTFKQSGAKWLLMLDADMVFPPDIISRLLKHASGKRIVGALCFGWTGQEAWPTMYDENFDVMHDWTPGDLVKVGGTGAACVLIPRTVFHEVPMPWYRTVTDEVGEDLYFCRKAREHGFEVYVDTATVVGHAKRTVITDRHYRREAREDGHMMRLRNPHEGL